jgi:2-polyprenyl-3-methyl-5-hydroxy-6-metoxy-1,4-benzoquinol methylase
VVGPLRYRDQAGYAAERYWSDRLAKYGEGVRGSGHEGLSERENAALNAQAGATLLAAIGSEGFDLTAVRVLEIGPGVGQWTKLLRDSGVDHYTGMDISNVLFDHLKAVFPGFVFTQGDICKTRPRGRYDIVLLLDVIEHIVTEESLSAALSNAVSALADNGLILVAFPHERRSPRPFFYLRLWEREHVASLLGTLALRSDAAWRDGVLIAARARSANTGNA